MSIIKCVIPTVLKKQPVQSKILLPDEKVKVIPNKTYSVTAYDFDEQNGHYLVDLTHGAGQWYLFPSHWILPWEDHEENEPRLEEEERELNLVKPIAKDPFLINWHDFDERISKYFTVGEVVKYDKNRIPQTRPTINNILTLAKRLDSLREDWASPIHVTSWHRPAAINAAVGGAINSQHILGSAVDIRPKEGNIYDFQRWLDKSAWTNNFLGYGAKKGFIHLDLRKGRVRWNY